MTEFHISQPGGLPVGRYSVEISLDGRTVETEDFEVRQAPRAQPHGQDGAKGRLRRTSRSPFWIR